MRKEFKRKTRSDEEYEYFSSNGAR
jgi:hypothetical protein